MVMLRYRIVPGPMGVVRGIGYRIMQEPLLYDTGTDSPCRILGSGALAASASSRRMDRHSIGTSRACATSSTVESQQWELRRVNCLTGWPREQQGRPSSMHRIDCRRAAMTVISATPMPTATSLPPTAGPTITPTSSAGSIATEPGHWSCRSNRNRDISGQTPPQRFFSTTLTVRRLPPTDACDTLASRRQSRQSRQHWRTARRWHGHGDARVSSSTLPRRQLAQNRQPQR